MFRFRTDGVYGVDLSSWIGSKGRYNNSGSCLGNTTLLITITDIQRDGKGIVADRADAKGTGLAESSSQCSPVRMLCL